MGGDWPMSIHRRRTNYILADTGPTPLIAYNFNDSAAADGTSANGGTLANAGSGGSGLNASIQQCTWQQGYTGRGLRFAPRAESSNTLTDRAFVAANSALNLTTGGTLMIRLKCSSTQFNEYGIFGLMDSSENQIFTIWANGSNGNPTRMVYSIRPSSGAGDNAVSLSSISGFSGIQNWHHYAVTYTSGSFLLYVDGVQRASRTDLTGNLSYSGNLTLDLGWIGFSNQSPGYGWNGDADDFRLYSTVLTQAEIAAIASS
jgi:hypothetical protein